MTRQESVLTCSRCGKPADHWYVPPKNGFKARCDNFPNFEAETYWPEPRRPSPRSSRRPLT